MPKYKFTPKTLILLGIAILIGGLYLWRRQSTKPEYAEFVVETQDMVETIELSGELVAGQSATLRFGAGGLVTYLGAKEGDRVAKWQTLASVDTRQLQKVMEQKLNLYAIQRGTFDQTIDDNDNSIPDGDLARTLSRLLAKNQYQLDNTVKDVEYQQLSLQLSRIYSPLAGILVASPITTPNVQVLATDTWTVVDPNSLEFVADLDETDLTQVTTGQKVVLTLDAYPDRNLATSVASISYAPVETTTGTTYQLKIPVPAAHLSDLRLGLNGTAALILQEKLGVLTLPATAIRLENGASVVLVKEGNKYVTREITTGIESDGRVEVVSGLGVGEHVYQVQ